MTVKVIETEFTEVAEVRPDGKKRVGVASALDALTQQLGYHAEDLRFAVCYNQVGQILLVPQVSVPLAEAWLYQNPKALASVMRGLSQSAAGEVGPPLDLEDE